MPGKQISSEKHAQIKILYEEGYSTCQIARRLQVAQRTVSRSIFNFKNFNFPTMKNAPKVWNGQPFVLVKEVVYGLCQKAQASMEQCTLRYWRAKYHHSWKLKGAPTSNMMEHRAIRQKRLRNGLVKLGLRSWESHRELLGAFEAKSGSTQPYIA